MDIAGFWYRMCTLENFGMGKFVRDVAEFWYTLIFFSKNHVYKNVEAQIAKKIRTS